MTLMDHAPPERAERLARIHDFLIAVDRFKQIVRQNYLTDGSRRENDAEHTWHMALYALLLHGEIATRVDITRVLGMILVHDLVEIHAGDTFAYDDAALAGQAAREQAAADLLFPMLPDDLARLVRGWWEEFEEGRTDEARFARTLDRLQAFTQNVVSRGKSWHEHGVGRERSLVRMREALDGDPAIAWLVERLYARADDEALWPAH